MLRDRGHSHRLYVVEGLLVIVTICYFTLYHAQLICHYSDEPQQTEATTLGLTF